MTNPTNVVFLGTPGNDDTTQLFTPLGLAGKDILEGDFGDDFLAGFKDKDQLKGEEGDDTLKGGSGNDSLFGGADDDEIFGNSQGDTIEGGGNSKTKVYSFDDHGEPVFEYLIGGDFISGGKGNDLIFGDDRATMDPFPTPATTGPEGNDTILGNAGNDRIFGQGGDDKIFGGSGADVIEGGLGDDSIRAGSGNDTILGQEQDDTIFGGSGDDSIDGGDGNDVIVGGRGDGIGPDGDTLTGGLGRDRFLFKRGQDFIGETDIITDFDVDNDIIDLRTFKLGVGAEDGDDFEYDDFVNGMTQGLNSRFYQVGADTIIEARPELGYDLGSLGTSGGVILKNVNIDDLGAKNFIFSNDDSGVITNDGDTNVSVQF